MLPALDEWLLVIGKQLIAHRRAETTMAQDFLNGSQIDSQLQQVRGCRMSKYGNRDGLREPG